MQPPKIKINKGALAEIKTKNPSLADPKALEKRLAGIVMMAEEMTGKALREVNAIHAKGSTAAKKKAWNRLSEAVDYLGAEKVTGKQINLLRKRIQRIFNRLQCKTLKITLKVQADASSSKALGSNNGFLLSPRKFVLYPRIFKKQDRSIALTIIHELFHDINLDYKVKDGDKKVLVYGNRLAKKLAKAKPKLARKNPENLECFIREVWNNR